MVDLLTVVPIWATINTVPIGYSEIKSTRDGFKYLLFGLNTTRILRALRIHKKLTTIVDEVQRSLGEMILTVCVLMMFSK